MVWPYLLEKRPLAYLLQVVASRTLIKVMMEQILIEGEMVTQNAQYYGSKNDLWLSILKVMIELERKRLKECSASISQWAIWSLFGKNESFLIKNN